MCEDESQSLTVPFGVSSLLTALFCAAASFEASKEDAKGAAALTHMPEKPTSVLFLISNAVELIHDSRSVLRKEVSLVPYCPSTPHTQNVSMPDLESSAGCTMAEPKT